MRRSGSALPIDISSRRTSIAVKSFSCSHQTQVLKCAGMFQVESYQSCDLSSIGDMYGILKFLFSSQVYFLLPRLIFRSTPSPFPHLSLSSLLTLLLSASRRKVK